MQQSRGETCCSGGEPKVAQSDHLLQSVSTPSVNVSGGVLHRVCIAHLGVYIWIVCIAVHSVSVVSSPSFRFILCVSQCVLMCVLCVCSLLMFTKIFKFFKREWQF